MNKEEQIEEMAKLIDGSECPSEKCPKMDKEQVKAFGACNIHRGQILYNAGYGNVKQAVKEFAGKFHDRCLSGLKNLVWEYGEGAMDVINIFDDLVKEVCGD